MSRQGQTPRKGPPDMNVGGMLRSLGGFVELISKLAEEGGSIDRKGEVEKLGKDGVKAVYGFSVRLGGAGAPRVEPFGNVTVGARGPVVDDVREPLVDVFDEEDHVLVVAELPGVEAKNVKFEVREDVLELTGAQRDRRYRKEVLLPAAVDGAKATLQDHNGVFELKLPKLRG